MAYIQVQKLPHRYKVVFRNNETNERHRVLIDAATFSPIANVLDLLTRRQAAIDRKDRSEQQRIEALLVGATAIAHEAEQTIFAAYSPGLNYAMWFVPYIETFDTPSKDLEEGQVWEGLDRHGQARVMWREPGKETAVENASDVVITRKDGVPDRIERKVR